MAVTRFGVSIPDQLVKAFDRRIRAKGYRARSEAIRDIMRDYLVAGEWERQEGPVVGTITVVYSHGTRELTRALTDIQHGFHGSVICSTHIHLDEHNCLEVVVVKGTTAQVQAIADRLISTRGVKHGKLVCTTTGSGLA
jgi:CopG family nickel-responsive transcriptional regulator